MLIRILPWNRIYIEIQDGQQYGDEYLAELDYIEVMESVKEGYEAEAYEDEELGDTSNRRRSNKSIYICTYTFCYIFSMLRVVRFQQHLSPQKIKLIQLLFYDNDLAYTEADEEWSGGEDDDHSKDTDFVVRIPGKYGLRTNIKRTKDKGKLVLCLLLKILIFIEMTFN